MESSLDESSEEMRTTNYMLLLSSYGTGHGEV